MNEDCINYGAAVIFLGIIFSNHEILYDDIKSTYTLGSFIYFLMQNALRKVFFSSFEGLWLFKHKYTVHVSHLLSVFNNNLHNNFGDKTLWLSFSLINFCESYSLYFILFIYFIFSNGHLQCINFFLWAQQMSFSMFILVTGWLNGFYS